MDKLKKFIDVFVPVTTCNFRCSYCYITTHRLFDTKLPVFKYSPAQIKAALSQERLGGRCMFNLCGDGETLLPPEMPDYIYALLEEEHYVMVVTNGTPTAAFQKLAAFPKEFLERLFFKFSYHYLQLKQRNLFDHYFANVRMMRDAGASFTVEATPCDDWIPYIDEMKERCIKEVGAPCHVTVARDERDMVHLPILSKLSREDYERTWSVFDSGMFKYKLSVFGEKQKGFCHAGDWTLSFNMGTGVLKQCYCSPIEQNIVDDPTKPIRFCPIGHFCDRPHCHNAHAFLTFGAIAERNDPTYDVMRNRQCVDGSEWLKPRMKEFMQQRLRDNNPPYALMKRLQSDARMASIIFSCKSKDLVRRTVRKIRNAVKG